MGEHVQSSRLNTKMGDMEAEGSAEIQLGISS